MDCPERLPRPFFLSEWRESIEFLGEKERIHHSPKEFESIFTGAVLCLKTQANTYLLGCLAPVVQKRIGAAVHNHMTLQADACVNHFGQHPEKVKKVRFSRAVRPDQHIDRAQLKILQFPEGLETRQGDIR
jgi:hypothetical protein